MVSVAKISRVINVNKGVLGGGRIVPLSLFLCIFLLFAVSVYAADITTPGEYLLSGGNQVINVSISYTDDDDNNNTLLIEWDEEGGDWTELLGSVSLDHMPSPYLYVITNLVNQSTCKVRITFRDGEITDGGRIFTGLKPYNGMVHTSLATGSSKWSGSGGWGITGGKYGRFTCNTCHQKGSGNAKQVKAALVVTDPAASDDKLPIELLGGAVVLDSLANGTSNLGDDSRDPSNVSTNICEACHSQTDFHRYNTAGQAGGPTHYNKSDCIKCHNHNEGFKAGCSGCHANPPEWNSHPAHLEEGRMLEALECATCHLSSDHISGLSEISFNPSETRLVAPAAYNDGDGIQTSRYTEAAGYVAGPAYGTCASVYCHSNGDPFDGPLAYQNQTWGGAAMTCSSCHAAAGDDSTLSSHHVKHVGTLYGFDCSKCHATVVSDSTTVVDNTLHLNNQKDVGFSNRGTYSVDRECSNTYCHDDGQNNGVSNPNVPVEWDVAHTTTCLSCHGDVDPAKDLALLGDSYRMLSGSHDVLASKLWIRQYPCEDCHYHTTDANNAIKAGDVHVNEQVDIAMHPDHVTAGRPAPSYDSVDQNCLNVYCHSDGRTANPVIVDLRWGVDVAHCDTCHGHQGACSDCHYEGNADGLKVLDSWPLGKKWLNSTPMYKNTGANTTNANSHVRHLQTNFSCVNCHAATIKEDDGSCVDCHLPDQDPIGNMDEDGHIYADKHDDRVKDVVFKDGGSYDPVTKSCSGTACHSGDHDAPQWGGTVACLTCHRSAAADQDSVDGVTGRINVTEWLTTGHGRPTTSGPYPSGNPAANFPTENPCWHCHDRSIVHDDPDNPYRLTMHPQYEKRFEKECLYCHMEAIDAECLSCHDTSESTLATQIDTILAPTNHVGKTSCVTATCHTNDSSQHNTDSGTWNATQKADIKNQYMMMGVCLQCHDDNSNDRCHSCHTWDEEAEGAPSPYVIGYNPGGIGFIAGASKASSTHFGHKHSAAHTNNGVWKGGKFCWDCHDPHGDNNIYMIQDQVATATDGTFGTPITRAEVVFTKKGSGTDYAQSSGPTPFTGICNVCHTDTDHYLANAGDNHRASRACTECHTHGFGGQHASGKGCGSCHAEKPIPNHVGFGLPRDCVSCHEGVIKLRVDVMRQFRGQSHHIQGENVAVENLHCYQCHWEATAEGLINNTYHEGYNYKDYSATPNAPSDLVIYGAGTRPTTYIPDVTAVTFDASSIATSRTDIVKLSQHCLSCHSDQNNDHTPFKIDDPDNPRLYNDCRTPRQYAWDRQSIDARYSQTDTTRWGKYSGPDAADKDVLKAFSAHGNAINNASGWDATNPAIGEDGTPGNTRAGTGLDKNVQCYDCHSSHGSYTPGVTSSYLTFDGTYRGGNLKETQGGKGGYNVTYKAVGTTEGINPMSAAAAQCFDCHETEAAGTMPWGYNSTYGATAPIMGYRDSARFGDGERGIQGRYDFKASRGNMGGHLKRSTASAPDLDNPPDAEHQINGSCTPCHDPHGVSPILGANQEYAVPLLKGTWLTSPFPEDAPQVVTTNANYGKTTSTVYPGRKVFGTVDGRTMGEANPMAEDASQFAGLCLRCHPKGALTDGTDKNTAFGTRDRVHETVKGWGNNQEHNFSCSKCHQAHVSGLPRLMRTNCLDWKHRGRTVADGILPRRYNDFKHYPQMNDIWPDCHETQTGTWSDQQWNEVTTW